VDNPTKARMVKEGV